MDIVKALRELYNEKKQLDLVISSLDRVLLGGLTNGRGELLCLRSNRSPRFCGPPRRPYRAGNYRLTFEIDGEDATNVDLEDYH